MPIPTRSYSLRQPGFSQAHSGGLKGTPDKEVDSSDEGAETFGPNHNTRKEIECDINHASRAAHSGPMGPPSQLKRASSLRKPSRPGLTTSVGTKHPLRNASSTNIPRTQNGSLLQVQPVLVGAPAVIQRLQSTDKLKTPQVSSVGTVAKPRISLHSRSQSVSGSIPPQAHAHVYIGTHSKDGSVSYQRKPPAKRLQTSAQAQNLSMITKITAGKPQFSTYRQHFSPKKLPIAPAPLISGRGNDQQQHTSSTSSEAITKYSEPDDEAPSSRAEIQRLQDELLQLQMIHDSSYSQQKTYLEGTMQKFKEQFAALSRDHRVLAAQESAYYMRANHVALRQWLGNADLSDSGKIQALAQCVQDIANLTAPDGKLCMAIGQFETWYEGMVLISDSRSSGTALLGYYDTLVSPMGQEWHDRVAVLHRKLDHCGRVLNGLGSAQEGSGLAMVLDAHKLFIDNLRQELEYSSAIERNTLQQEQTWIAESIAKIMQEDDPIAVDCQHDDIRRGAWNVDMT